MLRKQNKMRLAQICGIMAILALASNHVMEARAQGRPEPEWVDYPPSSAIYDVALVADPVGASERTIGERHYSIVELKPVTTVWGSTDVNGHLFASVGQSVPNGRQALSVAQAFNEGGRKLWFLRRSVPGIPAEFQIENCTMVGTGASLEEYRAMVAASAKYAGIQCIIIPWSRIVIEGMPLRVAVILTGPRKSEAVMSSLLDTQSPKEFRVLSSDGIPIGHSPTVGGKPDLRIEGKILAMRELSGLAQPRNTEDGTRVSVVGVASILMQAWRAPASASAPIYFEIVLRDKSGQLGVRSKPFPGLLYRAAWQNTDHHWVEAASETSLVFEDPKLLRDGWASSAPFTEQKLSQAGYVARRMAGTVENLKAEIRYNKVFVFVGHGKFEYDIGKLGFDDPLDQTGRFDVVAEGLQVDRRLGALREYRTPQGIPRQYYYAHLSCCSAGEDSSWQTGFGNADAVFGWEGEVHDAHANQFDEIFWHLVLDTGLSTYNAACDAGYATSFNIIWNYVEFIWNGHVAIATPRGSVYLKK